MTVVAFSSPGVEFGPLVANAEWGWVAAAVLFSAASYFAAAMALHTLRSAPLARAAAASSGDAAG